MNIPTSTGLNLNATPARTYFSSQRLIVVATIIALATAGIVLFTVGPFSRALPWAGHHVNIEIGDVSQVTLDRPLAHRPVPLVEGDPTGNPDVVRLIEVLQASRGLGRMQDDVSRGGYPDSVRVTDATGTLLTIVRAQVCLERNDNGDCYHFSYAEEDFQVYDKRIGGDGEVYHSPELAAWFEDMFPRYY